MRTILSTKNLKKSQVKMLEKADLKVIAEDFIKTKNSTFTLTELNEYLLFSSKNAVKSVLKNEQIEKIKTKKCFCVGQKTKKILEQKGFTVIEYKDNAKELADYLIAHHKEKSFTFFSGNLRKDDLPNLLMNNNIACIEYIVYETEFSTKKIDCEFDAILFFSPSGIKSFTEKNKIQNQMCFCIGKTTAHALENITKNIKIAPSTTIESVIETVIKYYK